MAEVAGLALGAISLASLCSSCIELADYITLASNLGRDFEVAFTKFLLLKTRLPAWSSCLGALESHRDWQNESAVVWRSLVALRQLLEGVVALEEKYGSSNGGSDTFGNENQMVVPNRLPSSDLFAVEHALDKAAKRRQKNMSLRKKFIWAVLIWEQIL